MNYLFKESDLNFKVKCFIPDGVIELFGIRMHSPFNGKPYGKPDMGCYACHCVLGGSAVSCSAHGITNANRSI